ncbi:GatB/YqeY domain-containing protein, partial [bacterium]|nr:GatB/YqeY domain-containing protein [bacterium]
QLSREEVEQAVAAAIAETGASKPADIGAVMKAVLAKTAGRADGKLVNEIARTKLSGT